MGLITKEIEVKVSPITPGVIIGSLCHFQTGSLDQTAIFKIEDDELDDELNRLDNALEISKIELTKLVKNVEKNIGKNEAKIFETHIVLLQDKQVLDKIINKIKNERINCEYAVKSVFEEYEELFAQMDDEYLKDRGTDLSEIKRRILSHLTGEKGKFLCNQHCKAKNCSRIVVTEELTPSMISLVQAHHITGFITRIGGASSHAAILTKAAGITYVTGVNLINKIKCGSPVIIDSDKKRVIFNPSLETLDKYEEVIQKRKKALHARTITYGPTAKTKSGIKINVYANIMSKDDIKYVNEYDLAGIGLVRTEFLFFSNKIFPKTEEQAEMYTDVIKRTGDKPVTFRLFDFGADKKIQSLKFRHEENPLLGLRGIRFLLKYKKILKDQVVALCKTKSTNIRILYPMISNLDELKKVNTVVKETLTENGLQDKIKVGMMFEVPSVFIDPAPYLNEVDFISIGTNDLVQYLFGVDRNNAEVSHLYNQDNPIVYKLLTNLINLAAEKKKDISLCGEINYNTKFIENIIKIGLRNISLTPIGAPELFERISEID